MSATGGTGNEAGPPVPRLRQIRMNTRRTVATLLRSPRCRVSWPSRGQLALGAAVAVAAVVATMFMFDPWSLAVARRLPASVIEAFGRFTELGLSGWFLWPLGIILIALAVLDTSAMPGFARHVLAAWAVRVNFVFVAIGAPGLFVSIVKRLIGRARPAVAGGDVFAYLPFAWRVDHASLPSGHATTAFSVLVAIGALFPQARALLWIYAVLIALSRVVVGAHYPSDVVAGAIVGSVGALLVRNWFAARRLGFLVGPSGAVHAMPGPSWRHIVRAIGHALCSERPGRRSG